LSIWIGYKWKIEIRVSPSLTIDLSLPTLAPAIRPYIVSAGSPIPIISNSILELAKDVGIDFSKKEKSGVQVREILENRGEEVLRQSLFRLWLNRVGHNQHLIVRSKNLISNLIW